MPRLSDLLDNDDTRRHLKRLGGSTPRKRSMRKGPLQRGGAGALPDFVAVDCETTGLDHRRDRIIEVAAIKYEAGKEARRFSSLVNPDRGVPPQISELTGITDADLEDAPAFSRLAGDLSAFIGTAPVCGHQVEFDVSFLNEEFKRLSLPILKNERLDTALLSRLLLPKLSAYSLSHVAGEIGHEIGSAHRATDDARASAEVAIALLPRIREISGPILARLARFAPPSLLKRILSRSAPGGRGPDQRPLFRSLPPAGEKLSEPEEYETVATEEVQGLFEDGGGISGVMTGFAPREAQTRMSLEVADTLRNQTVLLAEAGTGIGKSLAYLIPAALFALRNHSRVIVSTHTRNLQDQLVSKDLPIVKRALSGRVTFALLKGRGNYLCKHRFERLLAGTLGNLSRRERLGLLPLIRWAGETSTGDIEEQNQFNRKWFAKVWNLVSADSHGCLGGKCPLQEVCFVQHARRKALGSHIVVINHALFFSDVCAESPFLGPVGPIVFDEAHHLQSCGHRFLRTEIDTSRLNLYVDTVTNLAQALERSRDGEGCAQWAKRFKVPLRKLRKYTPNFGRELGVWARNRTRDNDMYQIRYGSDEIEHLGALGGIRIVLNELRDILREASHASESTGDGERDRCANEISSCEQLTSQLRADLAYTAAGRTEDHVFWVEGSHRKGWAKLCGVPLDIASLLEQIWERRSRALVFTSATLTVGGNPEYFLTKLGLSDTQRDRTTTAVFPAPFKESQSFRAAVPSSPNPDEPEFAGFLASTLARLVGECGKNTLVLFTSHAMLRTVYSLLRTSPTLPASRLLAQGISGNRYAVLSRFRASRGCLLLGTDSFWEGIDAAGEECEIVVVARLPFPVPTHPLTQAIAGMHEARYGESFTTYSVPEAVIKFRQGIGRLIRSPRDRGALIILDRRIVAKSYGATFVTSLSGPLVKCGDVDDLVGSVNRFLDTAVPEDEPEERIRYVPLDDV